MTTYKLVYVEWHDAHGVSPNWEYMNELVESGPAVCIVRTVGWMIHDSKVSKVIVPHVIGSEGGLRAQGCGEMTIPTRSIRRLVYLNIPNIRKKVPVTKRSALAKAARRERKFIRAYPY